MVHEEIIGFARYQTVLFLYQREKILTRDNGNFSTVAACKLKMLPRSKRHNFYSQLVTSHKMIIYST